MAARATPPDSVSPPAPLADLPEPADVATVALKEWAVVCAALSRGEQTVRHHCPVKPHNPMQTWPVGQQPDSMLLYTEYVSAVRTASPPFLHRKAKPQVLGLQVLLRKGGIREPTFRPAARRFLLLPTSFHSAADSLKPGVAATYAEVWSRNHT